MGFIDYYSTSYLILIGLSTFWAKTWANLIGLIGNFLLRKYFVFPEKNNTAK